MIKVLIVDDSAFVRDMLSKIISDHPDFEVVGTAADPYRAAEILNSKPVDVITLDLEMPKMDGLTFLEKLMHQRAYPVVVCSSIAEQGSENAIRALELGALEVITKPKIGLKDFFQDEQNKIIEALRSASQSNLSHLKSSIKNYKSGPHHPVQAKSSLLETTKKVIAIGASTGGTIAIKEILSALPENTQGIVITQHMPEGFTKSFASSLNKDSKLEVVESSGSNKILIGNAIVAKGNSHLIVERSGAYYQTKNSEMPFVNRHRPSVDVMFQSIAETVGNNCLAILLTGMGKDGAAGLKSIRDAGGITIAQSEQSCVVYGMPKAAIDINAALYQMNISEIIQFIKEYSLTG